MRFDQWKTIATELSGMYRIINEDIYFSILPLHSSAAMRSSQG